MRGVSKAAKNTLNKNPFQNKNVKYSLNVSIPNSSCKKEGTSLSTPKFQVANITGPDHQKIFEVHVQIDGKIFPPGMGTNKKTAEQTAAQLALEDLGAVF